MILFRQVFAGLLVGIILLVGCDAFFNYRLEVQQFRADMISSGEVSGGIIARLVGHAWQESGEEMARAVIADADRATTMDIAWFWPEEIAADVPPAMLAELHRPGEGSPLSVEIATSEDHLLKTFYAVSAGEGRHGFLVLSQDMQPLADYSKRVLIKGLAMALLLVLVIGCILYWFFHRKIQQPLAQLAAHAERIGEGDFRIAPTSHGSDELAQLCRTMNAMCSRLVIAKEKIGFEYEARLKTIEQLRHTERLSSFGLIAAGIAHEIGTPLNVVDGRAKMIARERLDEEEVIECASIIQAQVERITTIVRQLLDFTRRPTQQYREINVGLLIRQVLQLLEPMAAKQGVGFAITLEPSTDGMLKADTSQLQQVLVNLLLNSIQAMPEGGKVTVTLALTRQPERNSARDGVDKDYLRICITDEGEGIHQENLEHIFTPFFTTKTLGTGTGLGLSIAHGIVEEHGGWIEVESDPRMGTSFSVFLPKEGIAE